MRLSVILSRGGGGRVSLFPGPFLVTGPMSLPGGGRIGYTPPLRELRILLDQKKRASSARIIFQ